MGGRSCPNSWRGPPKKEGIKAKSGHAHGVPSEGREGEEAETCQERDMQLPSQLARATDVHADADATSVESAGGGAAA